MRPAKVRCIRLTGSDKAFAAGADIKEMATKPRRNVPRKLFGAETDRFIKTRKPIIAAVSGYVLGWVRTSMMCDFIIASDTAKFGSRNQPRRQGSWRHAAVDAVCRSKSMEMHLTGRFMNAEES
jgi:enoyl-CoA hydratase